jgi:uncharacterized protein (DUF1778 family)
MFATDQARPTPGRMEARKEVRMHRQDEQRIRAAALATGVQEADFIRQAALQMAAEVERRLSLSVLPIETFEAFLSAIEAPGKKVPGLAAAAKASEGLLKNGG